MSDDPISRQAAIKALGEEPMVWDEQDEYALGLKNQYRYDLAAIEAVPSAQKKGMWIVDEDGNIECSVCGHRGVGDLYCERCGARMDEEEPTMEEYMYGQEGSEEDGSL